MPTVFVRRFLVFVAFLVVIGAAAFSMYLTIVSADTYNLYSATCLGGWKNTSRAEGQPEATPGDSTSITDANSAVLEGDVAADLYCGGFHGDVDELSVPKRVLVRFSWRAEYPSQETTELDITPEEENTPMVPEDMPPTTEETPPPTSTQDKLPEVDAPSDLVVPEESNPTESEVLPIEIPPAPSPSETSSDEPSAWLWLWKFATVAYAQEPDTVGVDEEPTKPTVVSVEGNAPDESDEYGQLEVFYTLDGDTWHSLGFVNRNEFAHKYFEIPMEDVPQWSTISSIQIGVRSVPRIDGIRPTIYLDSMWIEVEYERSGDVALPDSAEQIGKIVNSASFFFAGFITHPTDSSDVTSLDSAATPLNSTSTETYLEASKLKEFKGISRQYVVGRVERGGTEEVWLFDLESNHMRRISDETGVLSSYPIGIKDSGVFWLNQNRTAVYGYNLDLNTLYDVPLPPPTSDDGRSSVRFPFSSWKIIVAPESFYFYSYQTGEIFSDAYSDIDEAFSLKYGLRNTLDTTSLSDLGLSVEYDYTEDEDGAPQE